MRSPATEVVITVEDSKITLDPPVAKIDSLKNPKISGAIVPARSGVEYVSRSSVLTHTRRRNHNDRFVGPILNLAELRQGLARDVPDPWDLQGSEP